MSLERDDTVDVIWDMRERHKTRERHAREMGCIVLRIICLFAEYHLFYRALLQKRPIILERVSLEKHERSRDTKVDEIWEWEKETVSWVDVMSLERDDTVLYRLSRETRKIKILERFKRLSLSPISYRCDVDAALYRLSRDTKDQKTQKIKIHERRSCVMSLTHVSHALYRLSRVFCLSLIYVVWCVSLS